MKKLLIVTLFFNQFLVFGQDSEQILSLEEYLGYIKKYHPILKKAKLLTSEGEFKLLKARGGFDPKLKILYNRKEFDGKEYYNTFNSVFKIPTWYGLEFKANYENNTGSYLNPESTVPADGLYSAGVSLSLAKGLLINERMAALRKGKLFVKESIEKQNLEVNKILFEAVSSYFTWLKNYQIKRVYEKYINNANIRLNNIKQSYLAGDKPAIDTLEASINLKNRYLDLEKSKINYIKSKLSASNYLWLNNDVPLELKTNVHPDIETISNIDSILETSITDVININIENHPKLKQLRLKKQILDIDRKLKRNNLLPKIDLNYNFLTADYRNVQTLTTANFKGGLHFTMPLFLRKERADLKLAKLKVKEMEYDIYNTKIVIENKLTAAIEQINSYMEQRMIVQSLVTDYTKLVNSEERKFNLGEGSLFLVNYREIKLIENELKYIATEYDLLQSKSELIQISNNFSL